MNSGVLVVPIMDKSMSRTTSAADDFPRRQVDVINAVKHFKWTLREVMETQKKQPLDGRLGSCTILLIPSERMYRLSSKWAMVREERGGVGPSWTPWPREFFTTPP
jgi:hypothetical protein